MQNLLQIYSYYSLFLILSSTPMDQQQSTYTHFPIFLPKPTVQLKQTFTQLKLFSKQRLDTSEQNPQGIDNAGQIKGLKFIASKLAKLFSKNRKLPYNEISKILIDNFASQQKDQRNIKRRVYDAINVLVAAGILIKKNNSIEMIKNKIKSKIELDKKSKIEEDIILKQMVIQNKLKQQQSLISKHKLIKKLFDRNAKILKNNEMKIQNSNAKNMLKSSLRKRSRNDIEIQSESKALIQRINIPAQLIYEPRLFIFTNENMNLSKPNSRIIQSFQSHDKIQIMVPFERKSNQKSQIQQIMNFMSNNEDYHKDRRMRSEMQQEDQIKYQMNEKEEQLQQIQISEKHIYSLLDLLQLLSLDEFDQQ